MVETLLFFNINFYSEIRGKNGLRTANRKINSYILDDVTAVINRACKSRKIHIRGRKKKLREDSENFYTPERGL